MTYQYIYDLADYNEEIAGIYNVIGFSPNSNLKKLEKYALYGIAVKRFGSIFDMPISKKKALDELNRNPQILEKFRRTFPFIELGF